MPNSRNRDNAFGRYGQSAEEKLPSKLLMYQGVLKRKGQPSSAPHITAPGRDLIVIKALSSSARLRPLAEQGLV